MAKQGRPPKQQTTMKITLNKDQKHLPDETEEEKIELPIVETKKETILPTPSKLSKSTILNKDIINDENLSHVKEKMEGGGPGKEMHKLLSYLARTIGPANILNISHDKSFADIIAVGGNKTYNTEQLDISAINDTYDIIIIDVDPHNGFFEKSVYDKCKEIKFNGIIIYDDIILNPNMRNFWNNIPEKEKIDVTSYGHWSGTGIVNFNKDITFICE